MQEAQNHPVYYISESIRWTDVTVVHNVNVLTVMVSAFAQTVSMFRVSLQTHIAAHTLHTPATLTHPNTECVGIVCIDDLYKITHTR